MPTVTGSIYANPSFNQTPTTGFLAGVALPVNATIQAVFRAAGVAADQVNLIHARTYTFVSATAQTIDLTALTDIVGGTVNFARVRLVAIRVKSTTDAARLTVGAAATNAWEGFLSPAGTFTVFPSTANSDGTVNNSGFFIMGAPNTTGVVVSGSTKSLKMLPSAHAFDVDVIIAGCDA